MRKIYIYLSVFIISGVCILSVTNDKLLSLAIGLFATALFGILEHIAVIYNRIWVAIICNTKYRNLYIRFSISYLYQIKVDDKYFLVRGNRIKDQYQPVGGVFKRFRDSNEIFRRLKILDDEHMPIDDMSRDDLRILVPGRNVIPFLHWFNSKKNREVSPEREFYEELVRTKLVSEEKFQRLDYSYLRTHETKIHFSEHFECKEILIAEIYRINLSPEQEEEFRGLLNNSSEQFVFLDATRIRKRGYQKNNYVRVSNTSKWII